MKRTPIFIILCMTIFVSCTSVKDLSFKDYDEFTSFLEPTALGYLNSYVVDSIQIDTPVVVITSNWHKMIMPYHTFIEYKGNERGLYKMEDVCFFMDDIPVLWYKQITPINFEYSQYQFAFKTKPCKCPMIQIPSANNKCYKKAYLFDNTSSSYPTSFYLVLISKQAFYCHNYGIDGHDIPKLPCYYTDYIRVLVPACR